VGYNTHRTCLASRPTHCVLVPCDEDPVDDGQHRFFANLMLDFISVVGYADDAIPVTLALRSVIRRAGREASIRHWPGTTMVCTPWDS
jgi:hypothetical protein